MWMKRETVEAAIELLEALDEVPTRPLGARRVELRFGSLILQQCIQELRGELDRHDLRSDSESEVDQCR